MSRFTLENDKKEGFPQDVVMMLGMLALGLRYKDIEFEGKNKKKKKAKRVPRKYRTNVGRRR